MKGNKEVIATSSAYQTFIFSHSKMNQQIQIFYHRQTGDKKNLRFDNENLFELEISYQIITNFKGKQI